MVSLAEQGRTPRFIETAADPQHKLGHTDPDNILLDSIRLDDFSPISGKEETIKELLSKNIKKLALPNATSDIVDIVEKLLNNKTKKKEVSKN